MVHNMFTYRNGNVALSLMYMLELIKTVHEYPKESIGIALFFIIIAFFFCASIVETIKLLKDK